MLSLPITVLFIGVGSAFCPLNSVRSPSRDKCFAYYNMQLNFNAAEAFCYNLGGHLASITNAFEASAISSLAAQSGVTINGFWIGANSSVGKDFAWLDATPFNYSKWANGEPRLECALVQLTDNLWSTAQCSNFYSFACALDPVPVTLQCDSEWTWFRPTNSCYTTIFHFNSFESAESICQSYDAHLASIHSQAENDFVIHLGTANYEFGMTEHDLQTWIGLHRSCKNCDWKWTDDSEVSLHLWAKNKPLHSDAHCVELYTDKAMMMDADNVGFWSNDQCKSRKRNAVCKKSL